MPLSTTLSGAHWIGFERSAERASALRGHDPQAGAGLEPTFCEATPAEIDRACRKADAALPAYAGIPAARRSAFLRAIAAAIADLGEVLFERTHQETALPMARLQGERARTLGQIEMFAALVTEGSWVDARIDRALTARTPMPRPDLRRIKVALGPVAVFGASNFPLAFSVAGGDTISALAAGCPVVVKANKAHPGASELVAGAIAHAAVTTDMPDGVFSLLQGANHAIGQALVSHEAIKAVAMTGSLAGGMAMYAAAARRREPIPVHAEMASTNPVFVLPDALATRGEAIAKGLAASVTLGSGQFCTNPGLALLVRSASANAFLRGVGEALRGAPAGTMVHAGIKSTYDTELEAVAGLPGVTVAARGTAAGPCVDTEARPAFLVADALSYQVHPRLGEEIYGPATVAIVCETADEVMQVARSLQGHLTATVHATARDLAAYPDLVPVLRRKVGRVVFNGFPTGVEVCPAMHHGGPYPATTDARATSVGTAAIERFARPVCYQDAPQDVLPPELQDANPRGIWRLVDGAFTRDPIRA